MIVGNLNNWWRLAKNDETGKVDMIRHRIWYIDGDQVTSTDEYQEVTAIDNQFYIDIGNGLIDNMWRCHEYRLIHRVGGPAVEIDGHPLQGEWLQYGKYHREDGPCQMSTCCGRLAATWKLHGLHHRVDGPAYEIIGDPNPESHVWYLNGKPLNIPLFEWLKDRNISTDWKTWTVAEKTMFKLKFMR